jgi:hypothetical protein
MNKEEIDKMFEGRWRIKSTGLMELDTSLFNRIKELCRDFFTAGIMLAERDMVSKGALTIAVEQPISDDEAFSVTFDTFWNAYDKKVGRPKCEKLWDKLTIKEKSDCLAYIPRYKQAQSDKQYRKNPETFLRNKSWNDELIYRNNTDLQRQQRLAASANLIAGYAAESNRTEGEVPETH